MEKVNGVFQSILQGFGLKVGLLKMLTKLMICIAKGSHLLCCVVSRPLLALTTYQKTLTALRQETLDSLVYQKTANSFCLRTLCERPRNYAALIAELMRRLKICAQMLLFRIWSPCSLRYKTALTLWKVFNRFNRWCIKTLLRIRLRLKTLLELVPAYCLSLCDSFEFMINLITDGLISMGLITEYIDALELEYRTLSMFRCKR
ncbi:hypothetical protein [Microviridae sp.]|nr:hypothetical protein [Microviridae sp.]